MSDIYVTAALKTDIENQAYYIFMKREYVKEYNAQGKTTGKRILYGPSNICDEFPSLKNTIFEDAGIDCAFGSHDPGEAYIFAWNNVAKWIYPSKSRRDEIIKDPVPISTMFPFLQGTVFESGVDAAFESSIKYEAYLFKGDQYARINYGTNNRGRLITTGPIHGYWPLFRGTIFENGNFSAALASHVKNEAYIFKGDSFVCIRFTPGATTDEIIGSVSKLKEHWPALGSYLPRRQLFLNVCRNIQQSYALCIQTALNCARVINLVFS